MDDILKLAENSGMSPEQGKTATGGIMSMLKQYIPADQYKKLESQIPALKGAEEQYGDKARETKSGGGGLMGAAMSLASGGGKSDEGDAPNGVPDLMATLTSMGIDPSMIQKFLPKISSFLKEKYGVDISQYVGGIPSGDANSGNDSGGSGNQASNLMGQAMGMFGK